MGKKKKENSSSAYEEAEEDNRPEEEIEEEGLKSLEQGKTGGRNPKPTSNKRSNEVSQKNKGI